MQQTTTSLLMVEPVCFGFNSDAAKTNSFQHIPNQSLAQDIQEKAKEEFTAFVHQLQALNIEVHVFQDQRVPHTPDAIFPNNWFSTHREGTLITYPMQPPNRRAERRKDIINFLNNRTSQHLVLEHFEQQVSPAYLEGTGSLVLDRTHKIAYAALSPRTHESVLSVFCERLDYTPVSFRAYGPDQKAIYHTNVMMFVGESFAGIGLDTVAPSDRERLMKQLENTGKETVQFSNDQIYRAFAGNMLQVKNKLGESVLVMSEKAFQTLTPQQLDVIERHNTHLLKVCIPTIEKYGGGSVRCMLAELFV